MADSIRLDVGQSVKARSGASYRNLQILGEGGNATTFLVVATSGAFRGVLFAAKVFRRLSKPERRARFLNEVAFLKQCAHPSIMRVFDEGEFDDKPFVVAEYLPHTLHQVIRSESATTVVKISYTLQLLSALSYLAELSEPVIHRDIKPRNVFIKGHSCVLGDFGLMKTQPASGGEDLAFFKESLEAPMPFRYRTPDLVDYLNKGTSPTVKSDVFQLGLVLAELFSGRNPLRASESFADPVKLDPLPRIPGAMGAGIANLINRMLAFDPNQREPARKLLDPWQSVFLDAVNRRRALEGKAF